MKFVETEFRNLNKYEIVDLPGSVPENTRICQLVNFGSKGADLVAGQYNGFKDSDESYDLCLYLYKKLDLVGYHSDLYRTLEEVVELGRKVLKDLIDCVSSLEIETIDDFEYKIQPVIDKYNLNVY